MLWLTYAKGDVTCAGAGLEGVHMREAAIATSPLVIRIIAPQVLADIARVMLFFPCPACTHLACSSALY